MSAIPWGERYPIPPNKHILNSEHLHAQTLFALAQAGQALRGSWGFFCPPGITEPANHVFFRDGHVVIENLALISPAGFTYRAVQTRALVPADGRLLCLSWTLPADSSENGGEVQIRLSVTPTNEPENPGRVVIGEIDRRDGFKPVIELTAPALAMDGAALLSTQWNELRTVLCHVADTINASPRGRPFERFVLRSAFRQLGNIRSDDPEKVTRELRAAVEQLDGFARAHASVGVVKETETFVLLAERCCAAAYEGLTALCDGLRRLTEALAKKPSVVEDWLQARGMRELEREQKKFEDGNLQVSSYPLADTSEPLLVALYQAGPEPATARCKFDPNLTRWQELAARRAGDRMEARLDPPGGASRLMVECDADVELTVMVGTDYVPPGASPETGASAGGQPTTGNKDEVERLRAVVLRQGKTLEALQAKLQGLNDQNSEPLDHARHFNVHEPPLPDTGQEPAPAPVQEPVRSLRPSSRRRILPWLPLVVVAIFGVAAILYLVLKF